MKLIQKIFIKIKDYFTANQGRKIFFMGLVATIVGFILFALTRSTGIRMIAMFALITAGVGTLWDTMYSRYIFLKKIRDIQYEHLKSIYDKQEAGETVEMTPTFTDKEKNYLRRRKWSFVLVIIFKVFLLIALFSLLLGV